MELRGLEPLTPCLPGRYPSSDLVGPRRVSSCLSGWRRAPVPRLSDVIGPSADASGMWLIVCGLTATRPSPRCPAGVTELNSSGAPPTSVEVVAH